MKKLSLRWFAFGGAADDPKYTHAANTGMRPAPFTDGGAPELARKLIQLLDTSPKLTAATFNALSVLDTAELRQSPQLRKKLITLTEPSSAISRGAVRDRRFVADSQQRSNYLAALRLATGAAMKEPAFVERLVQVLRTSPPVGGFDEPAVRQQAEAEWLGLQADAAQALLVLGASVDPYADQLFELWLKTSSREHHQLSSPHEALIDTCALVTAQPKLLGRFSDELRKRAASPWDEPVIVNGALRALGCARPLGAEDAQLIAEVFNAARAANAHKDAAQVAKESSIGMVPFDPVESVAAATLIQSGAAGRNGLPSIEDALAGARESALPAYQQLMRLAADDRRALAGQAVRLLGEKDKRLRGVGAGLAVRLWLAETVEPALLQRLFKAADDEADESCFRALLMIAGSDRAEPDLKLRVTDSFGRALKDAGPRRDAALGVLRNLVFRDEDPHIRGASSNVPVLLDEATANRLAQELEKLLEGPQGVRPGPGLLFALEALRQADVARKNKLIAPLVSGEGYTANAHDGPDEPTIAEALSKGGPLDLEGACHLMEMLINVSGNERNVIRSAAYYVAGSEQTAALLIKMVGREIPSDIGQPEARARFGAISAALDVGQGLGGLKDELGKQAAGLSSALGDNPEAAALRNEVARKADPVYRGAILNPRESRLTRFIREHWVLATVIAILSALCLLALGYGLMFRYHPRWALHFNAAVPSLGEILERLSGGKLKTGGIRLPPSWVYPPRLLDAWVESIAPAARRNFARYPTVEERSNYVSVPLSLNGERNLKPTPEDMAPIFCKELCRLVISGEGRTGKTSLACLLGAWAMHEDENLRLCRTHLMLPVLIEPEMEAQGVGGDEPFLALVGERLKLLAGGTGYDPKAMLGELLRQRRVLLILDGFSEFEKASRESYRLALTRLSVNTCIVTSRRGEVLRGLMTDHVEPLKVESGNLLSFLDSYLTKIGKRHLFDRAGLESGERRLSDMVGRREVPVFVAQHYAEQMARGAQGAGGGELTETILDLMLGYIASLHRGSPDEPALEVAIEVQEETRAAKAVAWECLKKDFRPSQARYEDALAAVGGEDAQELIQRLESLRVIEIVSPGDDHVRFMMDLLAEYLAAMHVVESYADDRERWEALLDRLKDEIRGGHALQGFVVALRDCCAREFAPPFVTQTLSELLSPSAE